MTKLNKVIENSLLYSLSTTLLRSLSLILFPIFSLYLTKSDYGILSITQSLTATITAVSSLQLNRAITRFVHDKTLKTSPNSVLCTALITILFSNSLWVLTFIFFGKIILQPILNDITFYPYMFYSLLTILFTCSVDTYRTFLNSIHKGKYAFIYEILYYGTNILLNLLFVVYYKLDVIGLIYSTILSGLIFSIYVFFKKIFIKDFKPNFKISKLFLRYSGPLIPFALLGFLLSETDKFILNYYFGSGYNGVYYIAFTIAGLFSTFKESVKKAITPWFFETYKENQNETLIKKVFYYTFYAVGITSIIISLFSKEVLELISSKLEFLEAWRYVPLICFGLFIVFIGQILSLPALYHKKTNLFFSSNLGGFIVATLLALLFIPFFGILGAVIAKIIGYIVMSSIQYFISKRNSNFRINLKQIFLLCLIALILSMFNFSYLFTENYLVEILLFTTKFIIVIFVSFLFLKLINKEFYEDLSLLKFIKVSLQNIFMKK